LAANKIDAAIAAGWWLRHARNREPLLRDQYVGISGNKKRFDLAAYAGAQHVLVAPHGRNPGVVSALRKIGMTRKVAITVPDFASAARLVAIIPSIIDSTSSSCRCNCPSLISLWRPIPVRCLIPQLFG
jgi:hypothetical protein